MKNLIAIVIIAVSGISVSSARAGEMTGHAHCSGGPKTFDWTSWKTVASEDGVDFQVSYKMEHRRAGYKTNSMIRFRYLNHRSGNAQATVRNLTVNTRANETYSLGGETVLVPGNSAVEGQDFIVRLAMDKMCNYRFDYDVAR